MNQDTVNVVVIIMLGVLIVIGYFILTKVDLLCKLLGVN
jgi:hypothetical protein